MTQAATLYDPADARATRYAAKSFEAFRVTERRTYPMPLAGLPATLDQALNMALTGSKVIYHKEHLLIRETEDGRTVLHLFAIKRKAAADYIPDPANHFKMIRVQRLYADKLCEIDAAVLS